MIFIHHLQIVIQQMTITLHIISVLNQQICHYLISTFLIRLNEMMKRARRQRRRDARRVCQQQEWNKKHSVGPKLNHVNAAEVEASSSSHAVWSSQVFPGLECFFFFFFWIFVALESNWRVIASSQVRQYDASGFSFFHLHVWLSLVNHRHDWSLKTSHSCSCSANVLWRWCRCFLQMMDQSLFPCFSSTRRGASHFPFMKDLC